MLFINLIRKTSWPLYGGLLCLIVPVILLGCHMLQATGGTFVLPHDESYLQLSTARTLAFRHIWGIGKIDFASATPSLLYPVVLAVVFWIFGTSMWVVPAVNFVIAAVFLWAVERWLAKRGLTPLPRAGILTALIFLPSLPVMILYGVESPLLLLTAFLFLSRLVDEWGAAAFSRQTLIYGALMMAARYDGVILLGGVCLLLLWQRRWLVAFELAFWCLFPVLVFGILAMFKGSYFLPNIFVERSLKAFLSFNWLVGCGVAVGTPMVWDYLKRPAGGRMRQAALVTGAILVPVLLTRDLYAFKGLQHSSREVARLQGPIARFVYRYYTRHGIVSDDIGLISFRADGRYWDPSGLGNARIAGSRAWAAQIAIISDEYGRALPKPWIRTARWELEGATGQGKAYTFYACDTFNVRLLTEHLEDFTPFLPSDLNIQYSDPSSAE